MRRTIVIYLIFCFLIPKSVEAKNNSLGNGLYWEIKDGVLTISGNGPMDDFYSPWEDKGRYDRVVIKPGVTRIGDACFWEYNKSNHIKSVVIPNTVITIGDSAFGYCSSLTSLTIPNSVTTIGFDAFWGCSSLVSVTIYNSEITIGDNAFTDCSSLQTVIPESIVSKFADEFYGCERLIGKQLIIGPNNVKYLIVHKGKFGLSTFDGKVIVAPELDYLEQCGTGFLRYNVNGFWGVMNYQGKIIIPTDRGYTKIGDYVSFSKTFPYEMDGYKGECNHLGQQVSKIKVANSQPSKPVAPSSSSSSSSSSSNKTSSSSSSSTASSNSSNSKNSANNKTTVVVEHRRDPVPVQEWVPCGACLGDGRCGTCGGSGRGSGSGGRCISCGYSGKCHFCNGQGGRYQTVYR